jgi:hypothetical protein
MEQLKSAGSLIWEWRFLRRELPMNGWSQWMMMLMALCDDYQLHQLIVYLNDK